MLNFKFDIAKLKQRLLTAVLLFPLLILGNLYLSDYIFYAIVSFIFLLAAWEWTQFISNKKLLKILVFCALVISSILIFFKFSKFLIISIGTVWWIVAWIAVLLYPIGSRLFANPIVVFISGWLTLVPAWVAFGYIYQDIPSGKFWLLYLIFVVIANDVGGYFAGNIFNGNKLAPKVSPKKTWSGLIGGFCLVMVVFSITVSFTDNLQILPLLLTTLLVTVFSVVGDLTESMFKRNFKLKDSGDLLPGHGGILDRLDSFSASLPLFALIKMII